MDKGVTDRNGDGPKALRRHAIIQEEIGALSRGGMPEHVACSGTSAERTRKRVRRLIAEEVRACLTSGIADKEGSTPRTVPIARVRASSAPSPTHLSHHLSLPYMQPSETTRRIQFHRGYSGGLISDAPAWQLDTSTAPILPSRHRELSRILWAGLNPEYRLYRDVPESVATLVNHGSSGPVTRCFANPRDDFMKYREEVLKPGNKLVMRKGGGSMKKTL